MIWATPILGHPHMNSSQHHVCILTRDLEKNLPTFWGYPDQPIMMIPQWSVVMDDLKLIHWAAGFFLGRLGRSTSHMDEITSKLHEIIGDFARNKDILGDEKKPFGTVVINLGWLVVGEKPLWKIWTSIGMISNPIYGKIKNVPNQPAIYLHPGFYVRIPLHLLRFPVAFGPSLGEIPGSRSPQCRLRSHS